MKRISVSFCDEKGKFVFYDNLANNMYDMTKKSFEKNTLFNQIIPFSLSYLL
jgi:hypothetical protein